MPNLGASELLLILAVVVLVFGATKLPQLGDGLGKAIKNFKRAVRSQNEIDVTPKKSSIEAGEADEHLESEPRASVKADK